MKENIILSQLRNGAGNFNARLFKYLSISVIITYASCRHRYQICKNILKEQRKEF